MPQLQDDSNHVAESKQTPGNEFSNARKTSTVIVLTVGAIGVAYWMVGFNAERANILFWWPLRVLWLHQPPFVSAVALWRDFGYYTYSPNPDASILYAATAITYAIEYVIMAAFAYLATRIFKAKAVTTVLMFIVVGSVLFYLALVVSGLLSMLLGTFS